MVERECAVRERGEKVCCFPVPCYGVTGGAHWWFVRSPLGREMFRIQVFGLDLK